MKLSIIIPVLNESSLISDCLASLHELRQRGHDVITPEGHLAEYPNGPDEPHR